MADIAPTRRVTAVAAIEAPPSQRVRSSSGSIPSTRFNAAAAQASRISGSLSRSSSETHAVRPRRSAHWLSSVVLP